MKRRNFVKSGTIAAFAGTGLLNACTQTNTENSALLGKTQIQHGVIFSLKHQPESPEAKKFLQDGKRILTGIPVVQNFQAFRQVSGKNDYEYGFTMIFDSMDDYQTYNDHPDHVAFVEQRWKNEVTEFLEIDFEVYPEGE